MADEKNNPLSEVLRAQIIELVSKGDDKNGGRLTPEVLSKVVRVAKTGRDLLVSLDSSNLANMVRRPNSPFGLASYSGQSSGDGDMESDSSLGSQFPSPYAMAAPAENFGMVAIRELVAVAKNLNGQNSPAKLVEALVIAREHGLHDVAKELEAQLGIGKPEPAPKLETTISAGDGVTKTVVKEEKS